MFQATERIAAVVAVALITLIGCAPSPTASSSAECPDSPLVSSVYLDATASSMSDDYADLVSRIATRTTSCEGMLTVSTFGESSGQTVILLDQSFLVEAPTENAKNRKQQQLAEDAAATVRDKFDTAAADTPSSATDVIGVLRLIGEAYAQHPDAVLEVTLATDGATNVGVDPAAASSKEAALGLAEQVEVPDLSGVHLTFAGIGRTTSPVPSTVVEQISVFWERVCERTNASSCTVATQWRG